MLSNPAVQRRVSRSGRRRRRRPRDGTLNVSRSRQEVAPPANRPRGLTRVATVWEDCMTVRISLVSAAAVALVFATTSTASAQADTTRRTQSDTTRRTTTSQTRVRVTKESNGDVTIRRDSAFIRDSVARADSISRAERMRQDSITRADSVNRMEQMRRDSITRDSTARADSMARAAAAKPATDTIRTPVTPTMSSEEYGGMHRGGWYLGL